MKWCLATLAWSCVGWCSPWFGRAEMSSFLLLAHWYGCGLEQVFQAFRIWASSLGWQLDAMIKWVFWIYSVVHPSAENGSKPGPFFRHLGVILASFLEDFFLKPLILFVLYTCNSIVGRLGSFSRHLSWWDAVGQRESPFPYIFFFINIPFWLCCLYPRVLTSHMCLFFPPFSSGTPRNVSFQWGEVLL